MDLGYLIQLLDNKLKSLILAKDQAFMGGDLERITVIDSEILEVQDTLSKLKFALGFSNAAATANTTPEKIMTSGIEAINSQPIQGPSASAIVNGYDISAYATDSSHEQKIQTIVGSMPPFNTAEEIDVYIQNFASGSPITGEMVIYSSDLYSVDKTLLLAIMQNDSSFGTLGIGARTFNPGNVGNNGITEKTYDSWMLGVEAVADWLNAHKINSTGPSDISN